MNDVKAAQCDRHQNSARYERGEAVPMPAVVNLFKLLDKHPELLKEPIAP